MPIISTLPVGAFFLLMALTVRAEYQLLDRVIAIAEDEVVLASDVRNQMQSIKNGLARSGRRMPPDSVLYEQVLEKAIIDSLQLQRAYELGLRIPDQELNQAMESIAAQNGLSLIAFKDLVEAEGESFTAIREKARRDMLIQRIQQRSVMRKINISKSETDNFLASEAGKALIQPEYSIDHILLPISTANDTEKVALQKIERLRETAVSSLQFIDIAAEITAINARHSPLGWRKQKEIPSMFADTVRALNVGEVSQPIRSDSGFHLIRINKKRGGVEEIVNETWVRHILIKESEIRSREQALTLLDDIGQRLENGQPFKELARLYSDDPGSALQGGDLGWSTPGTMVPEFETVMNAATIGEVSDVFESSFGWHILQVIDRREKDMTSENAERQARMAIAQTKYDDELNNWLQELRDNAFVEIR